MNELDRVKKQQSLMAIAEMVPALLGRAKEQAHALIDVAAMAPGLAYFLATGKTPHRAYRGMRRLTYMTDGRFNDAVHEVIRRVHPPVALDRAAGVLGNMAEDSEENGHHVGLGWIPGHVRRLRVPSEYSVPHVGWNDVQLLRRDPLFNRTGDAPNFYFDHSYHFVCEPAFQAAVCDYAGPVTAAVQRDNVFGVQFHPERSQASGLKLLRGFFVSVGG